MTNSSFIKEKKLKKGGEVWVWVGAGWVGGKWHKKEKEWQ
jgi:hypothetical protein